MKITMVLDRLILPVSLRRACDISRACRPTCSSPISPSISARGVRAATESTTITSTAPERLLTRIRLADQQILDIDAQLAGIDRIERVLCIDERRRAAAPLHLGHD